MTGNGLGAHVEESGILNGSAIGTRYSVHGTELAICTSSAELDSLVGRYYQYFKSSTSANRPAHLWIQIDLGTSASTWPEARRLGTDIRAKAGGVQMIAAPGLSVDFLASERRGPWHFKASFREPYVRALARRLLRGSVAKRSNMLMVLRYAVHYPLFMHQQLVQNRSTLHAAAAQKDGEAILFCGLNGVGKSTLALMLVRLFGYTLLSDNFVLTDGQNVYGFPEQARLTERSRAQLGIGVPTMAKTHGRYQVDVSSYIGQLTACPVLVVFPELVPVTSGEYPAPIHPLEPALAQARLDSMHSALGESPEFSSYALAAHTLFGTTAANVSAAAHGRLSQQARAISLRVPIGASVQVYERLLRDLLAQVPKN